MHNDVTKFCQQNLSLHLHDTAHAFRHIPTLHVGSHTSNMRRRRARLQHCRADSEWQT